MNAHIEKYLARYAEAESLTVPDSGPYKYSLVIPASRERAADVRNVWSNLDTGDTFIVILVVNNDPSAMKLVSELTAGRRLNKISDRLLLIRGGQEPDLLLVDRYSNGHTIDQRQGVGLARKIGADIALRLHHDGVVSSGWLYTTDADATLPAGYFSQEPSPTDVAMLYPFHHLPPTVPTLLYEISMLYYAAGLAWAGSPYAYPTLGSTIACRPGSYAAVRGFPRRNTGEDFYLLNKLRKLGNITTINTDEILLQSRFSDRVPVGTGPAIRRIANLAEPLSDYRFEHPGCFTLLRDFLSLLHNLATTRPGEPDHPDPRIRAYCELIGLHDRYARAKNRKPADIEKHFMDWFDGLRTRQFIHHMRDRHFGVVPVRDLSLAPFTNTRWLGEESLVQIRRELAKRIYV